MVNTNSLSGLISNLDDDTQDLHDLIASFLIDTEFRSEALAFTTHLVHDPKWLHALKKLNSSAEPDFGSIPFLKKSSDFDFIDLFAGIGGFRLALERSGGRAVFSSEWDPTAKAIYFKNHGDFPFGDINVFTGKQVSNDLLNELVPDHDFLAAGFPCQPFSAAGVSARGAIGQMHGFECKTQGTLFFSIKRIAEIKRPKVLLLENVKNILSHDRGKTFEIIRESIESIGYCFDWKLLDAQTITPQRRVRCFMVCVREDIYEERGSFSFPDLPTTSLPLSSILEGSPDPSYTISERLWEGHCKRTKRNLERGTGFTAAMADVSRPSNTIVARYGKDGKECLIPNRQGPPRFLTISECKKLFGYPDDFVLPPNRTPTYKLLGNSVVVPLVELLTGAIKDQYLT